MSAPAAAETTRKGLPMWAILSLSLAIVGPTLAMSGNASGLALAVGKSAPLVMLIGLVAGLFASFVNSFIAACQEGSSNPWQIPWSIPALVAIVAAVATAC